METVIALADCQNFYASCQRLFEPSLWNRPVAVLSNNDGCVIARSEEVKEAGVEMGAPYFKCRGLLNHIGAVVFSSNFALYGELQGRICNIYDRFAIEQEEYSIDESFLTLPKLSRPELEDLALTIREQVRRLVGIPIRVGVASTKTLAKLANHTAKMRLRSGEGNGVFVEPERTCEQIQHLRAIPTGEVWGIGPAYEELLTSRGITTAMGVACLPDEWARRQMTVTGLRTVMELRGHRCLEIEDAPAPKKTITRSRTFSSAVEDLKDVQEAVSTYASKAARKLREGGLVARGIRVFLATSRFDDGPSYSNAAGGRFEQATNYTPRLAAAARQGIARIYRQGFAFKKAGVTFYDLTPEEPEQPTLFSGDCNSQEEALMKAVDEINSSMGARTVHLASTGTEQPWRMKKEWLSPRYTTRWDELPVVKA